MVDNCQDGQTSFFHATSQQFLSTDASGIATRVADWRRRHPPEQSSASKFAANVARDKRNLLALQELGWKALVVWECEIRTDVEASAEKVFHWLGSALRNSTSG